MGEPRRRRPLSDYPVFPTLLTSGNLACGVTAILCAMSAGGTQADAGGGQVGLLFYGAVLIFAAMVFDMFDGKVARMTGTDGEFGAELDSIADIVSFGVAPAILVHRAVLGTPPMMVVGEGERWIWFLSVFYVVMTGIRLARYNVEHDTETTRFFFGLPSPGAAATLAAWVMLYSWFADRAGQWDDTFIASHLGLGLAELRHVTRWMLMFLTALTALLMVSRIQFLHVGNVLLSGRIQLWRLVLILVIVGLLGTTPLVMLTVLTTGYILIGTTLGCWGWCRRLRGGERETGDQVE